MQRMCIAFSCVWAYVLLTNRNRNKCNLSTYGQHAAKTMQFIIVRIDQYLSVFEKEWKLKLKTIECIISG